MMRPALGQLWSQATGKVASLGRSRLLGRVGMLGAATVAGQAITFAASPLLSRLFSPEAFGLLGLFTSMAAVVGNVATLRYDVGIVTARRSAEAAILLSICILLPCAVSFALGGLLLLGADDWLADFVGNAQFSDVLTWMPVQVLATGLFFVLGQWATRRGDYPAQARGIILRALLVAILQLAAGLLLLGPYGLVAAQALGVLSSAAWIGIELWVHGHLPPVRRLRVDRMTTVARRFARFPAYVLPQEIISGLTQFSPIFLLGVFFGTHVVGLYWFANRMLQLPINLASQSIRQAYLQHVVEDLRKERPIGSDMIAITAALAVAGGVIFIPLAFAAPTIFVIVFGEEWKEAGYYAQWLGLGWFTSLIKVPSWAVLHAFDTQKAMLAFEASVFLCQIAAICITVSAGAPTVVASLALVTVVFNLAYITFAFRLVARSTRVLA